MSNDPPQEAAKAHCWGSNDLGQLGTGDYTDYLLPEPVLEGSWGPGYQFVSTGGAHACGLTTAGYLFSWGGNGEGQLAHGDYLFKRFPQPIRDGG